MQARHGFTLIELLVVMGIIAVMLGILLPTLGRARESGREAVCASNIRQLALANTAYAFDNRQHYVPAAEDIFTGFGGTKRWHGVRQSDTVTADPTANAFDPSLGPLAEYGALDDAGRVKLCPSFRQYVDDGAQNAFEASTGGYGYNATYVGGRYDLFGSSDKSAQTTARVDDVRDPTETVMFAEAAMPQRAGFGVDPIYITEYSFVEQPYHQIDPGESSPWLTTPSTHFRHNGRCNVAWCDGHVGHQTLSFSAPNWAYHVTESENLELGFGYFGPMSNELFRLE